MTEKTVGGKADVAATLRGYAKEQGELARRLRAGTIDPIFYVLETRGREKVRVAVSGDRLSEKERLRQRAEAARAAEKARRTANKEARGLEA